jgi:hypothetical protein
VSAPNWTLPSEQDLAAIRTVHERLGRENVHRYVAEYGLNDTALAEIILLGYDMLWYHQAQEVDHRPTEPGGHPDDRDLQAGRGAGVGVGDHGVQRRARTVVAPARVLGGQ